MSIATGQINAVTMKAYNLIPSRAKLFRRMMIHLPTLPGLTTLYHCLIKAAVTNEKAQTHLQFMRLVLLHPLKYSRELD